MYIFSAPPEQKIYLKTGFSHPFCPQVSSPHTFFPPYERASPRHHGASPLHRWGNLPPPQVFTCSWL